MLIKSNLGEKAIKTNYTKISLETISLKSIYFRDESEEILIKSQNVLKNYAEIINY